MSFAYLPICLYWLGFFVVAWLYQMLWDSYLEPVARKQQLSRANKLLDAATERRKEEDAAAPAPAVDTTTVAFWERHYKKKAQQEGFECYGSIEGSKELREWIGLACGELGPCATLLDVGCGTSAFSTLVAGDLKQEVTSIDFSTRAVEIARRLFPARKEQFTVMDARKLLYVDRHFDGVIEKGTIDGILQVWRRSWLKRSMRAKPDIDGIRALPAGRKH